MRPRSYLLAALASLGVVGVGVGAGVAGQELAHSSTTPTTEAQQATPAPTVTVTVSPEASATSTPSLSASATASASASGLKDGTYTGAAVQTRYGDVQVQITVANGKITTAQATEYPSQDPRDQQINSYAVPILNGEVTEAQSASISQVSGATFTSQGYVTSLQAALEQAQA